MLANRMKLVREALHLSQREFGEGLGVSRDVICNIEYGRVEPKKLLLQHLCRQYRVSESWLTTGEGEMFAPGPEDPAGELLDLYRSLRPEFRECALAQLRLLAELQERSQRPGPQRDGRGRSDP